jgi:hypothetical protein
MELKETEKKQRERLEQICIEKSVDYGLLETLLLSTKTKKLFKRNNYHQQKISDVIEKAIK